MTKNNYIPGAPRDPDAADHDPKDVYAEGDINSSDRGTGARANKGKVALSLVPFHLLGGAARVLMGGTLKYKAWNWAKGMAWSTSMDCLLRHLFKWWYLGEDTDPDSGEHHLDHVLANALFLRHGVDTHLTGDDRPPTDVAHFDESRDTLSKLFDEEAFLERNPDIRKLVEERVRKEISDREKAAVQAADVHVFDSLGKDAAARTQGPCGCGKPIHCSTPLPLRPGCDPCDPEANLTTPPPLRTPRGFDPEGNPD
jgi:hypothetical protein